MARWTARHVAEAVGIIGIIGSLTFVGGERRQNVIATRAAANAEVSNAFVDLNLMLAWNPDLARAFAQHANDPASAPQEAQIPMLDRGERYFKSGSTYTGRTSTGRSSRQSTKPSYRKFPLTLLAQWNSMTTPTCLGAKR